MEIRIRIQTPPGQAEFQTKGVVGFLFKKLVSKATAEETYINDDKSELALSYQVNAKQYVALRTRINMFSVLAEQLLNRGIVKKSIKAMTGNSADDIEAVKKMLTNQTSVEIINELTPAELDEFDKISRGETLWQRIKRTFTKKKDEPLPADTNI